MLTASQFDAIPTNILKLYHEYEDSVIADMVRRLVKMDYATSSAAWQMQRVIESGAVYEDVLKKLAGFTGKTEKELAEAFSAAGVKSMRFDDSIYKAAGLDPLPLNLSPQMAQVLANGLRTTNGFMQNITRSTALSAQRQFLQASDLAYLQVSSGAFSYDQAIKAAVKGIGESGLGVVYPSGRVDQLDVAVRRAVLTGVGKTSGDLQLARASEMGQDLVETSAHIGARPAHVLWQGQVFSLSGTSKQYPDFVTSTGYGTALGLNGINCRHSFYPFFEGISTAIYEKAELESYANKTVTYNGKKMTVYEATQEQRAIERQIRSFKRQENALQAGGLDASAEAAKVRDLQAKMRSFTKQTGLSRQGVREQVVSKTINASTQKAVSSVTPDYNDRFAQSGSTFSDTAKHGEYIKNLSDEESKSIRRYTGSYYDSINKTLREGVSVEEDQDIFRIHKAISEAPSTTKDVKVFRTMTLKDQDLELLQQGSIFTDKGFVSTSLDEHAGFAGNVKSTILLPEGSNNLLNIESISVHESEKEILLQNGAKFFVQEVVKPSSPYGNTIVKLIYLGVD